MNRTALLGSTALVAAMSSYSAMAGTVGTGDNLDVSLSGEVRTQINHVDQDKSDGFGRGIRLHTDEAELVIEASSTADNGLMYGVEIVLNVDIDDTQNGDKVFAFIDSEQYGRVQLGDNDNAADSLFVDAADVVAARGGFDGEVSDVFAFGDTWIGVGTDNVGKATKIAYFTPNIAGFTLGASYTPDSGQAGASFGERDDDGDFENTFDIAGNWEGSFSGLDIVVAAFAEFGQAENNTSATPATAPGEPGDAETYGVGATVGYGGFSVGAGYVTFNEAGISSANQALGADAGDWWDIAVAYRTGPWGVSVGYYEATLGNVTGVSDTKNTVLTFDADYEVAPGWTLAGSLSFNEADNRDRTQGDDNDGHSGIIYNIFAF